jgi:N-methylhydantoinase A
MTALARNMGVTTFHSAETPIALCTFGQIISDIKYNDMATSPNDAAYSRINRLIKKTEK